MVKKIAFIAIIIFLILTCTSFINKGNSDTIIHIRKGNLYQDVFIEPFEIVLVFFPNGDIITMTANDEYCIPVSSSLFAEYLKKVDEDIKEAIIIIHNHPLPYPFSRGDINFYRGIKKLGFHGFFAIYYPFNGKTIFYKKEN